MKIKRGLTILILLLTCSAIRAVDVTLYINKGQMQMVDSTSMPYLAFNWTWYFQQNSTHLAVRLGDTLKVTLINQDTADHQFYFDDGNSDTLFVSSSDTGYIEFKANKIGCYKYGEPRKPYQYLGLSGVLAVTRTESAPNFYWNIRSHDKNFSAMLLAGFEPAWQIYDPDYFTLNGLSNPHTMEDPTSRITGKVEDVIYLYIVNPSRSSHSLHLHGYHAQIISSKYYPDRIGWSKDTVPVEAGECILLEIVPDKPGEFPVHDHNLVATLGAGLYPNGMFTTILIEE